ncbi:MAG: anthranilate synthase component I [Candidatus Cloacimonetes bacterium]|jgi:anthranilate synthase component 1|nr:anthranilate synthase component I [Candidatus Cloacimonadota bacterium]
MLIPDRAAFLRHARDGRLVPVRREILFDTDTAVGAYAKLARPPFGFLLESVEGGETWARYTFLGTEPHAAWRLHTDGTTSRWTPQSGWGEPHRPADPIAELADLVRARDTIPLPGFPRFIGGAVGYLGYDAVRYIERLPHAPPDTRGLPDAVFLFTDLVVAIDNLFGRASVIALVDPAGAQDEAALLSRYDAAGARIDSLLQRLTQAPPLTPLEMQTGPAPEATSAYDRERFEEHVRRIQQYIIDGDAFQVVLSRQLEVPLHARPFDVYRMLRSLNPSPYLFFLELDDVTILGSSPEALVRVENGRVVVRPIAGTRPRGSSEEEDRARAADLIADEKERAEHLMLVDLGRNDVGRVAEFGSVKVTELMAVETYSHVLHMVSRVEGDLRAGLDAFDALRACFPAGTVSGAPRIRAMEIIDELEPVRRGPYAGAVGYFAYGGQTMDTAIAIRTLVAKGDTAWLQAGAGIVADSLPEKEFEETVAKAGALIEALRRSPPAG